MNENKNLFYHQSPAVLERFVYKYCFLVNTKAVDSPEGALLLAV